MKVLIDFGDPLAKGDLSFLALATLVNFGRWGVADPFPLVSHYSKL
jgi:hypothetical protein